MCRSDQVKECRKALVAQYTGTLESGTNDNPLVTFIIVRSEGNC